MVVEPYGSLQSPLQALANGTLQSPFLLSKLFTKSPNSFQAPQTLAIMDQMTTMKSNEVGGCFKAQANPFKKDKKMNFSPQSTNFTWERRERFREQNRERFLNRGSDEGAFRE